MVVTYTNIKKNWVKITYHPLLITFVTQTMFHNYLSVPHKFLQLSPVKALTRILQINPNPKRYNQ